MTGTKTSSADLDPRRRKLHFRAWHRGMREMDLILGSFADDSIRTMSDTELDQLETLMNENDQDLFKWVIGEREIPADVDGPMLRRVIAHRRAMIF